VSNNNNNNFSNSQKENILKSEISNFAQERNVLQKTIIDLETILKEYNSYQNEQEREEEHKYMNDLQANYNTSNTSTNDNVNNNNYDNKLIKKLSRYQKRCNVLEDIITSYRKNLFTISTNSTTSNNGSSNSNGSSSNWIEKNIELIRRSYVDEIHSLELDIDELQHILQHNNIYKEELRLHLSETLKKCIKNNKDDNMLIITNQLNHLTNELQYNQQQNILLNKQITQLKSNDRNKFEKLITEITNLMQNKENLEILNNNSKNEFNLELSKEHKKYQVLLLHISYIYIYFDINLFVYVCIYVCLY
jgi:hypothetical protein